MMQPKIAAASVEREYLGSFAHATGHARLRAWERYGLDPTADDWRDAWLEITASVLREDGAGALLMARLPDASEIWIVRLCARTVVVLYRPDTATIITVLPQHPKTMMIGRGSR
jgi:hypothetical protein